MSLAPLDLFDLDGFEHKAIFDGCEHVWDALEKIPGYVCSHVQAVTAMAWGILE